MNMQSRFTLTYETVDSDRQELLANELATLGGITVRADNHGGRHVVVIDCYRDIAAVLMHELVMTFDPDAELVHSVNGPSSQPTPA
jgi:hypothetical protein